MREACACAVQTGKDRNGAALVAGDAGLMNGLYLGYQQVVIHFLAHDNKDLGKGS